MLPITTKLQCLHKIPQREMTTVTGYQGAELGGGGGIAGVFHFSSGMVSVLRACMGHGSERKLHCRPRKRGW